MNELQAAVALIMFRDRIRFFAKQFNLIPGASSTKPVADPWRGAGGHGPWPQMEKVNHLYMEHTVN